MSEAPTFDIDTEIARVTALLAQLNAAKGETAPTPAPAVLEEPAPAAAPAVVATAEDREHVVTGGEVLATIAAAHGVPAEAIAFASVQAGRIINPDQLPTGARLIIPGDARMIIE